MAVNGTRLIDQPFNTTYSPWTDLFENLIGIDGVGMLFWFIPMIGLTLGVYIKTKDPVMTTGFMMVSGALLGSSSYIFGMRPEMYVAFTIFTALGITGMFITLFLQRKGVI